MQDEQKMQKIIWTNPLPDCQWALPLGKYQDGGFGSKRAYSLHTGIDLSCEDNQLLASVEEGIVVGVKDFSKRKNKTPWLNRTRVILIEGKSGVCVYCNVKEKPGLKVGTKVKAGEIIGKVIRINKKKRKNNNDTCMLHLELYAKGTRKRVTWSHVYPKPPHLLDPTQYLIDIITDTQVIYRRRGKA